MWVYKTGPFIVIPWCAVLLERITINTALLLFDSKHNKCRNYEKYRYYSILKF